MEPLRATIGPDNRERGFTLVELLVTLAITTVILGTTMVAMSDAVRATDTATMLTSVNNNLRTAMDMMVRDMLQVGQGLPTGRVIFLPTGSGSQPIRIPGPPGTNYQLVGATEFPAVLPGPGLGPVVDGQQTDMITTLASDSAFDQRELIAFAADGSSITINPNGDAGADITDGGPDDVRPGDLIMLTKGSMSTLVQVTRVSGQTLFFDANDSLNLNQAGAADGNARSVRDWAPQDPLNGTGQTRATRIRMITYYIDATTDPDRPRLVRRINNGDPMVFDNTLGTAVAFDIENLQATFDLVDGSGNPANVRMEAADLDGSGACSPDPCSPNQIRKLNLLLAGRSRIPMRATRRFLRNQLVTQVSFRSLSFVDEYR